MTRSKECFSPVLLLAFCLLSLGAVQAQDRYNRSFATATDSKSVSRDGSKDA